MTTSKKIFIFSFIFFILAICIAGYILFFRKNSVVGTAPIASGSLPFGSSSGVRPPSAPQNIAPARLDSFGNPILTINRLMELSALPAAGSIAFMEGSTTLVRFNQKGDGHSTEINLLTGTTSPLSNVTIPFVYETVWMNGGQTFLARYPDSNDAGIITYSADLIPGTTTVSGVNGTYLRDNIESIAISPDTKKAFYLVRSGAGENGATAFSNGSGESLLYNSSFSDWNAAWPEKNTIALTTKPSANAKGILYTIDIPTRKMRKVLDGVSGLTAIMSSDLSKVAYSSSNANLSIYDPKTNINRGVAATLSDKCVWSRKQTNILYCAEPISVPTGEFPDDWYKGLVTFTDALYKIDTSTGSNTLIGDLVNSYRQNIDAINPQLSPDENYLTFGNKKDYTLWSYKINP